MIDPYAPGTAANPSRIVLSTPPRRLTKDALEARKNQIRDLLKRGCTRPCDIAWCLAISPSYVSQLIRTIARDDERERLRAEREARRTA